jgi:hypothetical protein
VGPHPEDRRAGASYNGWIHAMALARPVCVTKPTYHRGPSGADERAILRSEPFEQMVAAASSLARLLLGRLAGIRSPALKLPQ